VVAIERLVEKYRPRSLDDVLGQDEVVSALKSMLQRRMIPHLLFLGPPGCGKTSVAICLARELYGEDWRRRFVELNASDERGIDTIRGKVKRLAMTVGEKMIFMDEADNLTEDAQQALRRIMEITKSTVFVLAGNKEERIIPPILSRCAIFRFKRLSDSMVLRRILEICRSEGVRIDPAAKEGINMLVKEARGDLRWCINSLEKIIDAGKTISPRTVAELKRPEFVGEALKLAIGGDFERAKDLLEDAYINSRFNVDSIIEGFYSAIDDLKDRELKIRLYSKLGEVEGRIRNGGTPLLQCTSFLAYCWIAPHLPKGCPARETE